MLLLAIDLEATCWEGPGAPKDESEIIEIGACVFDPQTNDIVSSFSTFIRPVVHSTLSAFCTKLTTITQEQVDQAPLPDQATAVFNSWIQSIIHAHGEIALWCSWGNYDRNALAKFQNINNVVLSLPDHHVNAKKIEGKAAGVKPSGMYKALVRSGVKFEGTRHRGVDDAIGVARITQAMWKRSQTFRSLLLQ